MKVEWIEGAVLVSRPKGSPRIAKESTFWHELQQAINTLNTQPGLRWVRIRPHMTSLTSMPYALRQGPPRKRNAAIIDNYYALRDVSDQYNNGLTVRLSRVSLEAA